MRVLIGLGFSTVLSSPAHALCIYRGVDNAKTSVEQEFRDSEWVVRAHVVSADYHWSNDGDSWTLYRLAVTQQFKRNLPEKVTVFTQRHSGGFYMDGQGVVPDLDSEYLLFLVPHHWSRTDPPAAKGALRVNYSCGQSRTWSQVTSKHIAQLQALAPRP